MRPDRDGHDEHAGPTDHRPHPVLVVFGTRPEAIKMAPLVAALRGDRRFRTRVCVTAQHRGLLDQVLRVFDLRPDIDLDLMATNQDLNDLGAAVLSGVGRVLAAARPDCLLVHGDTTTALAAALAGFHAGVPVAHVEAGLRSFDRDAPFPEETNRRLITRIARWHCAPTPGNRANLLADGVEPDAIAVTGNTVVDALAAVTRALERDSERRAAVAGRLRAALPFDWRHDRFVLITGHRRENIGGAVAAICQAVDELASRFSRVRFVYPVHPNPRVHDAVHRRLGGRANIHLLAPLDYEAFVCLMRRATLLLTDSGGLQEEAPTIGVPLLLMREVTERPEALASGAARIVGTDPDAIVAAVSSLLSDARQRDAMTGIANPFGDGQASSRICAFLAARLRAARR